MREIPFSGHLDVALGCLVLLERHGSVANRCVARDELASDLLAIVPFLEIPPESLSDVDAFEVEMERSLLRLVAAGWIEDRTVRGRPVFSPRPVAQDVVAWVRARLGPDAKRLAAFDRLDAAVTARVLSDYGHTQPSRAKSPRS